MSDVSWTRSIVLGQDLALFPIGYLSRELQLRASVSAFDNMEGMLLDSRQATCRKKPSY